MMREEEEGEDEDDASSVSIFQPDGSLHTIHTVECTVAVAVVKAHRECMYAGDGLSRLIERVEGGGFARWLRSM